MRSPLFAAALLVIGCGKQPARQTPTPVPGPSGTRIYAAAASGEALPADYVQRIEVPVRVLVDGVQQDSSWTRQLFFTVRRNGTLRFDREAAVGDSVGGAVAEKIAKAAAAGAFTPLPFGWDDSLSLDLRVVHPPAGLPVPDTSGAYFELQVTRPVTSVHAEVPRYPATLQSAHLGGRVIVKFIVGTDGRAEPASVRPIVSPHPDLSAAAVAAVLASTYRPAELKGRIVRQIVMQPFEFSAP